MDRSTRIEIDLAHTEVQQIIRDLERAAEGVLSKLPAAQLTRLGLCAQHPEAVEDRLEYGAGDWLDAIAPLVGRVLQDRGPDRVVTDMRTRALIGALQDGLAVRDQP